MIMVYIYIHRKSLIYSKPSIKYIMSIIEAHYMVLIEYHNRIMYAIENVSTYTIYAVKWVFFRIEDPLDIFVHT